MRRGTRHAPGAADPPPQWRISTGDTRWNARPVLIGGGRMSRELDASPTATHIFATLRVWGTAWPAKPEHLNGCLSPMGKEKARCCQTPPVSVSLDPSRASTRATTYCKDTSINAVTPTIHPILAGGHPRLARRRVWNQPRISRSSTPMFSHSCD